jgi:LAS superfamily LD-carboxypeptidase LdcB
VIANLAAALLIAASVAPSQPFPDQGEPLSDAAYVEDLVAAGAGNGLLPADSLVLIESSPGCLIEDEAAEAWLLMAAHALADGIDFTPSWCYRNLATQKRTYRRNCPKVPVEPPTAVDEPEDGAIEDPAGPVATVRVCSPPTAKPGNSNHGWGRAVDITADDQLLTCQSAAFGWLDENAHLYGWVHPIWAACGEPKQEAWHWEWGATREPPPRPNPHRATPY